MIDPARACLFIPAKLSRPKNELFERIAKTVGRVIRYSFADLERLPDDVVPIVGCTPELRPIIDGWLKRKRVFAYWDRGYLDRIYATCLPEGDAGGYFRWHLNAYQMKSVRSVPDDRLRALKSSKVVRPWQKNGRHIVIAAPTRTYCRFHRCESWIADTIDALARVTDRQLVIRDKEQYKRRPIQKDIEGAHALVTHGSNAAVESVVLGCPVFVHPDSAAALVGKTDIKQIESPVYPDREWWLRSLTYCQFNQQEILSGQVWKLIS